jgi:hypothetical protein
MAENYLTEHSMVKSRDKLIVVADIFAGEERFDSIQLRTVH